MWLRSYSTAAQANARWRYANNILRLSPAMGRFLPLKGIVARQPADLRFQTSDKNKGTQDFESRVPYHFRGFCLRRL